MTDVAGASSASEQGNEERARAEQHLEGDEREVRLATPDEQEFAPDPEDLDTEDPAAIASNELHPEKTPEELYRNEQQGAGDDDE
jgi:hypothetical protein